MKKIIGKALMKGWTITHRDFNHIYVLERGLAVIIAYPTTDKYRENGKVYVGLAKRLGIEQ